MLVRICEGYDSQVRTLVITTEKMRVLSVVVPSLYKELQDTRLYTGVYLGWGVPFNNGYLIVKWYCYQIYYLLNTPRDLL